MSIVVTCDCTMEYRLPDRYAGKRCRCRECGGRIEVPRARSSHEERTRKRKKKKDKAKAKAKAKRAESAQPEEREAGKKAKAKRKRNKKKRRALANTTTRRLGPPQQAEILSERRELRSSQRARRSLPSESMHQLAPLRPGNRMENMLGSSATRKRRRKKGEQGEARKKAKARRPKKGEGETASKTKKKKKGRAEERKGPSRRRTERLGKGKNKAGRGPQRRRVAARRPRTRGGRRQLDSDEEINVPAASGTRHALYAVVAIVGVLCLGIGVIVGGGLLFGDGIAAIGGGLQEDIKAIETLAIQRNWDGAKAKLDILKEKVKDDPSDQRKISQVRVAVEMMTQLRGIEDEEQRMGTLVKYSVHENALVRHGIAWELRPLAAGIDEAQEALAALAMDTDKRVAEAARQALVQAGGPYAVPYLEEAIVKYSATGGRQAEVALERALEVDDLAVVPVLMKVLEVRKNAPAAVLKTVIERLGEFGDPAAIPAVEPFTSHGDESVKTTATEVLEELKAAQG